MIKRLVHALAPALRQLIHNWRALIILFVLYLAMLGAGYQFFVTREATVSQLLLSSLLALAVPVLFLVIQTMLPDTTRKASSRPRSLEVRYGTSGSC
jgi:hypothetical protein